MTTATTATDADCIFCKIASKQIPAKVVWEDEHALAFRDLNPQAPHHALVIPKKHLVGIDAAGEGDADLLGRVMLGARATAHAMGLNEGGYRLVINHGPDAGQSVFHLHVHVLGGRKLAWPPG